LRRYNKISFYDVIITCEEHSVIGGLFSAVSEVIVQNDYSCTVIPVVVMDTFGESGKPQELLEKYEINAASILKKLNELL
jgi:transketolase